MGEEEVGEGGGEDDDLGGAFLRGGLRPEEEGVEVGDQFCG